MPNAAEGQTRKFKPGLVLRLLVAAGALYLVFGSEDLTHLWDTLLSLNPWFLLLTVVLYLSSQVIFVARWLVILSVQEVRISLLSGLKLHLIGLFYNNCLPSAVGGDFLRAWYVTKHAPSGKKVEAAFSVFVDRAVGLSGMIIMALAAYWLIPVPESQQPAETSNQSSAAGTQWIHTLGDHKYLLVTAALLIAIILVSALSLPQVRRKGIKVYQKLRNAVVHLLHKCFVAGALYLKRPLAILMAFGLTFCCQAIPILGFYLLGRNLGMNVPMKFYYVLFPVSWMVGAIPVSIGGIGIVEGSLKFAFAAFPGASAVQAAALALCQRLVLLIGSLPGVLVHVAGAHLPTETEKQQFLVDVEQIEP